ncbi:MAG: methylated-DNA--[Clostridia bacterium]|nr:methylated-DNA--[protein]-cysteine S-methyltransferase [Clostridia bacterium]
MTEIRFLPSPVGRLTLAAREGALVGLWLENQRFYRAGLPSDAREAPNAAPFPMIAEWLEAYFNGKAPDASALPLAPDGTAFQKRVWAELRRVPYGRTTTYSQLAAALASSPRAVGGAVGRNPISLLIPCHRVIGAHGELTGYAGGLENKRLLLRLEGVLR